MQKRNFYLALMAATAVLSSCSNDVQQQGQQVTIKLQHPEGNVRMVRLEVMSDKIIRVSATAENRFADRASLIVVPQAQQTPYQMNQTPELVTVTTSSIVAQVDKFTGRVVFTDLEGNTILAEQEQGGKTFEPYHCEQTVWTANADGPAEQANVRGYDGWSTRVIFDSPADEAFYGLGQHQADDWNYKGRNEELFQYNTKVSIPFVVSSHNYGVLVDSYSLMRFGNPHDYSQLPALFDLVDKDGQPGALTGTYAAPGQETLVRREDSIYFENLKSAKNLPAFNLANATVTYEGEIIPRESGEYRFSHYYSGYQKIYIDGKNVYTEDVAGTGKEGDQTIWRTAWNPNARKFAVNLEAGHSYKFRLEWIPDGGEAYCGLRALAPVAEAEQQQLSFWSEMTQQLDYYFIAGQNADEVVGGYRQLTGKSQIMPKWLFGYWQSRERYKSQREILDALQGFRDRQLPIDNIVMDWNYWTPDAWGAFEFDPTRFNDPKGMIDTIHAQNAKIMISCWPKYYLTVDHFDELNNMGKIYQQSIKDSLYDWLGYKYAFYDAYDLDARLVFWRQLYEHLGTIGMDAWWMDASEPNVRDCTDLPYRKLLCGPTALGSSDEYFNAYSIVNAEAIYDGQRAYETAVERQGIDPNDSQALQANTKWNQQGYGNDQFSPENRRVFLLTRNGFAAEQRFSTATWSGDIGTRWEDMKTQITAGLNFSISGVPYWSQDIGGFSVEKRYEAAQRVFDNTGRETEDLKDWRELNVRWHQWGVFTPMYRTHGQFPYREPWNIAPESHPAYRSIRSNIEFRYRMMPYIYSLAADVHFRDYTMLRPLVMDFGQDPKVLNLGYQFMFGPSFMVCPVYQYKSREREVYFPAGRTWYCLHSGQVASQQGGESKVCPAPYDRIPVFVPSGSIIPYGPALQYVDEHQADVIRLYVYQGQDGTFTLYEDEGTNYGYEAGRYANIRFSYSEADRTLSIADREGEFPGMLQERTFIVVPVSADKAQGYDPEASGIEVKYDGKATSVKI